MAKIERNSEFSNDSWGSQTHTRERGLSMVFRYSGYQVTFRVINDVIYVNATEISKYLNKSAVDWYRLDFTRECLEILSSRKECPIYELCISIKGGNSGQGIWIGDDMVWEFFRWLSPVFAVRWNVIAGVALSC